VREAPTIDRILERDRPAIARAISVLEAGGPAAVALIDALHGRTGRAHRIGITGPPGAGKSTLVGGMVRRLRAAGRTVAVLAVDPSSPFTHGAILGDRVRMGEVGGDDGVFIRSMATRGNAGGLSRSTVDAADVLDAAGFDCIVIETAGVGQTELAIAGAADTTVVVLVPESGDDIQAMKAGLGEIADLFVLNKCDRPGAGEAASAIQSIVRARDGGHPRVIRAVAIEDRGVAELIEAITAHRAALNGSGRLRALRAAHLADRIRAIADDLRAPRFWDAARRARLAACAERVLDGELSPYEAAQSLLEGSAGDSTT
jgi:LAO/AO transport system kinase